MFCGIAFGQSLTLSPVSGLPGATVTTNLTLASAGIQAAGLQWTLTYPASQIAAVTVSAGTALQSSGKTVTCAAARGAYTCLATGLNGKTIPDGVVAVVSVALTSSFSGTTIGVSNTLGASLAGSGITIAGVGGAISSSGSSSGSAATFVSSNASLAGTWKTTFGADGYGIAGDLSNYPAYATVAVNLPTAFSWSSSTTDLRALQKATSLTDRIAAAWYSSASLSVDINLTDSATHQVAIYCLDWDQQQRAETISVVDAQTNAVLDTRVVSNFGSGQYLAWNISGHVKFQIAANSGPNAVISGIFFGGAAPAAAARYLTTDTTTQGSWQAVYGGEGFSLAGDKSTTPSYGGASPYASQTYTWSTTTTNTRALQQANAPAERVAGCWYAAGSFAVTVTFSDTIAHQVALYFLDWDTQQRAQTITVLSAATNAVLDTRTVSSFGGGQYLVWNLQGGVRFLITRTAGPNAVVSGIFFGGPTGSPAVSFVKIDSATQGTWSGVYGSDGFNVIPGFPISPGYVTVNSMPPGTITWAPATSDPRALQQSFNSMNRVAAAWTSSQPFYIDLTASTPAPYRIAFYFLDWDNQKRTQQITVLNGDTNAVLDARVLSNFSGGQYLVWNVSGHIRLAITPVSGSSAVVSGWFFR